MKEKNESEAQDKLSSATMNALIKVTSLEKTLIDKGIITTQELAEATATIVSDVTKVARKLIEKTEDTKGD